MRLIKILSPDNPGKFDITEDQSNTRMTRIPMWYLGGSRKDYDGFMTSQLFEGLALVESAIDRYLPMLNVLKNIDELTGRGGPPLKLDYDVDPTGYYQRALNELDWAMRVLKRQDRIVWYMRIVKLSLLDKAAETPVQPSLESPDRLVNHPGLSQPDILLKIHQEYSKAHGKIRKIYTDDGEIIRAIRTVETAHFTRSMEHYLSMGIAKIDATVWDKQHPNELMKHFGDIEVEWIDRRDSTIDMDDDHDDADRFITFPDGSAWFDLGRTTCSVEAKAMGHCGNAGGSGTDTVLTYRVPVDKGGSKRKPNYEGNHWRPRMTFILNTSNGFLGEMKGRANDKPIEELHPYIIALLRHNRIKGIIGGGYLPENNFSMDDLAEDVRDQLIEEKPGLGSTKYMLEKNGITDDLIERIDAVLDSIQISHNGYNEDRKEWAIESFDNISAFVKVYGGDNAKSVAKVVLENDDSPFHWDMPDGDRDERVELAEKYFKDHQEELKELKMYMQGAYPEHFGYPEGDEDFDPEDDPEFYIDDMDDLLRVAEDESEDFYDQIGHAISDGHRVGAETEMYDTFWGWVDDPFGITGVSLFYGTDKYDGNADMMMTLDELVTHIDPSQIDALEYAGDWAEIVEVEDLQEPYHGYNGYDDDAALQAFHDVVEFPVSPKSKNPYGGPAHADNLIKVKADIKEISEPVEGAAKSRFIKKYNINLSRFDIVNGAITFDAWSKENLPNRTDLFMQAMDYMRELADKYEIAFLLQSYHGQYIDDEAMVRNRWKKTDKGYYWYGPKDMFEATTIKLGSRPDHGGSKKFIEELWAAGEPHPFNHRSIMIGPVGIEAYPYENYIHLSDIVTYYDHDQGHGTDALKFLIQLAEKHKVRLTGTAKAYSKDENHITDTNRLAGWYRKHGFEIGDGNEEDGFSISYDPGLHEAPVGDYAPIGNWGDKEKSNSFSHRRDRMMIQNQGQVKNVRKRFGNTEHILNFYFVNLPGARTYAETGLVDEEWLTKNMPEAWELIKQREGQQDTNPDEAINVIFVGNAGANRKAMSAWIMAHRIGHALQRGAPTQRPFARGQGYEQGKINSWNDYEREIKEMVIRIFDEVYKVDAKKMRDGVSNFWFNPDLAKFFEAIGTMNSAIKGNLGGRPYEFLHEMFAQYITTGKLTFRDLPRSFGRRGWWHGVQDEEMWEMYSRDLNGWWNDHLTSYMDNCLYEATGKYLVM